MKLSYFFNDDLNTLLQSVVDNYSYKVAESIALEISKLNAEIYDLKIGYKNKYQEWFSHGFNNGYSDGYEVGYDEGYQSSTDIDCEDY